MSAVALPAPAALPVAFDAAHLVREVPDSARAAEFGGIAMVQSFRVVLPGAEHGRCWIPTAAALAVPGFGRSWVAGRLAGRAAASGWPALRERLLAPGGVRLDEE